MKLATTCSATLCALAILTLTPATASAARWRVHGWVGPGVYHVGHRRYAHRYPRHSHHWYSLDFSTAPWRYRGRDDRGWIEE